MKILVTVLALVVPAVMIILGLIFKKNPPKNINGCVGYRTRRSRSSQEAWDFAQARMTESFIKCGTSLMCGSAIMAIILFANMDLSENMMVVALDCIIVVQLLIMVAAMLSIEKELKEKF